MKMLIITGTPGRIRTYDLRSKMTMRYSHLSPDHKRAAVKKIEAVLKGDKKVIQLPLGQN